MHDYPVIIFAALVLAVIWSFFQIIREVHDHRTHGFYFRGYTHEFFYR